MDDKKEKKSADAEKDAAEGSETPNKPECAICLQPSVQPVQLPCRHIFCYLCVKGATQQSKRCAMCRREIPLNYLDNPQLIAVEEPPVAFEGTYQWFYEGRNGWWRYDSRTSVEIETAYKKEETQCEVLIAGYLYIIDFEKNLQYRRSEPHRRRRIKRDLVSIPIKGIAGIRFDDNEVSNASSNDDVAVCSSSDDSSSNTKLGVLPPTTESVPACGNTQSTNITTPASGNEGDPLSFLRTQPPFQQLRQVIQLNPQFLNGILQQIGRSNPQLLQLISQNQESFVNMLNEPTATQGSNPSQGSGGGAATGTGSAGSIPMDSTIVSTQVSRQDREATERNDRKHVPHAHDENHPAQKNSPINQCSNHSKPRDPFMGPPSWAHASGSTSSCGPSMCQRHQGCPMSSPMGPTMNNYMMSSSACGYRDGWGTPPCPCRIQGDSGSGYNSSRCCSGYGSLYTGPPGPLHGQPGCGSYGNRCACGNCGPCYNSCSCSSGHCSLCSGIPDNQHGHPGYTGHSNRCLCGCSRGFSGSNIGGPSATNPSPVVTPDSRQTGLLPPGHGIGTRCNVADGNCSAQCTCYTQDTNDSAQGARMSRHCQNYHPYRRQ